MQCILVIDNNTSTTRQLRRGLCCAGYSVVVARSGEAGLTLARDDPPNLIVLDILLPGVDGLEVLRRLRAADSQLPILILTAKDAPVDQVRGLESGADDYIVKPFSFDVLLAHIRALLRRSHASRPSVLRFTNLTIDTSSYQVRRGQRNLVLTALEFKLLQTFLEHPEQVLSKDTLLGQVWGADFRGSTNIVEVYVKQLRQKLEADGEPRLLHTIRRAGYILRDVRAYDQPRTAPL